MVKGGTIDFDNGEDLDETECCNNTERTVLVTNYLFMMCFLTYSSREHVHTSQSQLQKGNVILSVYVAIMSVTPS